LGKKYLSFTATREHAGLYTCSVPSMPIVPTVFIEIVVHCK